jgi:hypothetical protein
MGHGSSDFEYRSCWHSVSTLEDCDSEVGASTIARNVGLRGSKLSRGNKLEGKRPRASPFVGFKSY